MNFRPIGLAHHWRKESFEQVWTGYRHRSAVAVPNAWFESGLSGALWPLRLKPYDDELLSSWLVRLSRVYGTETSRFGVSLTRDSSFWSRDIDKGIYPEVLE